MKTTCIDLFSVQLNHLYVFIEISSCSKDSRKDCAALLLTRFTALSSNEQAGFREEIGLKPVCSLNLIIIF